MFFNTSINLDSLCIVALIIICGIFFINLQKTRKLEPFPVSLRYTDKLHHQPKLLLPKITNEMHYQAHNIKTLPDDYDHHKHD